MTSSTTVSAHAMTSFPTAFALTTIAAVLLAGCASMKGLDTQATMIDMDHLASQHSLAGVALTSAPWLRDDWWKSLGDPQLDGLIDEALAGNPSLAAADARVHIALAQADAQNATRKPEVGAKAAYSGIRIPATVAPAPFGGHYLGLEMLSLSVGYSPDLWGGKRAAWEAAVDQAHAAQVDAQAARLVLAANIAQAYAALANAYVLGDLAKSELDRSNGTRKLIAQRVKAGIDNQIQLRQTDTAVAVAQRGIEAAHEQIALLQAELAALAGQGPDRGLKIERPRALTAAALELPADLPSELLARRPDIVAARWRVEASERGIKAAKAQFYPSVNLSAAVGLASGSLSTLFELPSRYLQVGPAISLPIFDGGRLRAGLSERDATYDGAVAQYNQTLVDALHQVAEQVITLRAIDRQIATQQQALDAAQSAYDLGMKRYRSGLSAYLDVLSVQEPLLKSQQALADLHAQRLVASVKLAEALGGGFRLDTSRPLNDVSRAPDSQTSTPQSLAVPTGSAH